MAEVPLDSAWEDLHPFRRGRTFRVDLVSARAGKPVAICTVLTDVVGVVTSQVGWRITLAVADFTDDTYRRIEEA